MSVDPSRLDTSWLADQVELNDALARFDAQKIGDAIAFAYTPTSAPWLRRLDHGWRTRDGEPVPPSTFEMRAFTATAEFRWWRTQPSGYGRCAVVSEGADQPIPSTSATAYSPRTTSVLLWGRAAAPSGDGWTRLIDGRIDSELWVPIDVEREGCAVRLELVEYWAEDEHGNVGVVEQRLTRLFAQEPS